jgi:hypothetical protein
MNMPASTVRGLIFYLPPLYKMKCGVDGGVMNRQTFEFLPTYRNNYVRPTFCAELLNYDTWRARTWLPA